MGHEILKIAVCSMINMVPLIFGSEVPQPPNPESSHRPLNTKIGYECLYFAWYNPSTRRCEIWLSVGMPGRSRRWPMKTISLQLA
jgi:hypothetical protein